MCPALILNHLQLPKDEEEEDFRPSVSASQQLKDGGGGTACSSAVRGCKLTRIACLLICIAATWLRRQASLPIDNGKDEEDKEEQRPTGVKNGDDS